MVSPLSLTDYCAALATADRSLAPVAQAIRALADASARIADRIALGELAGHMSEASGGVNSDGDRQSLLDLECNAILIEALAAAPVAEVASEENDGVVTLRPGAPLAVAIDPLDGSKNVDTNVSVGTIFSIVPASPETPVLQSFGAPGTRQLAAGFALYGSQTALVLTVGKGVQVFTLDRRLGDFRMVRERLTIPGDTREYAINASNYRHWEQPVRTYIDDCINGAAGIRGKDFNMRWMGSLVAEAYRVLVRGGIFLYPADKRPGYETGRLRLVYEGHPMAFLVEQAGGKASTGRERILDLAATSLHQRVPLIFGSAGKVDRVVGLHLAPETAVETAPLFARRGLFRV